MGRVGVKVWIYKGDILAEAKVEEAEETVAAPESGDSSKATLVVPTESSVEAEKSPAKTVASVGAEARSSVEPKESNVTA